MDFAYATMANKMSEKFGKFDFIIYYYEDAWMACSRDQRIVLCDHELCHCGVDGTPFMKDHDITEFKAIANDYGLEPPDYHWASVAVKKILAEREAETE